MTPDQRDSMSPEVRAEYEVILAELVLERGWVVKADPSEYGWTDQAFEEWTRGYQRRSHLVKCKPRASGAVREDVTWSQFVGTFAPGGPNETRHGIEVDQVVCSCGRVNLRTVRLEATISDLTGAVFERLYQRLTAARDRDPLPGWPDPAARPSY